MAPPQSDQPEATAGSAAISKVLIVIAMQTEAASLVNKLNLVDAPPHESTFPKGAPWVRYHSNYKCLHIDLVWLGKDPVLGVDSVGTVSTALVTYASIQILKPELIINAGTAGGFKAKGASIGDVFLASDVAFHDRRIPIPADVSEIARDTMPILELDKLPEVTRCFNIVLCLIVIGVDNVGAISAALVTCASIQTLKPDFIINAGTAGGFKEKGVSIGDVFLASDVAFHNRRFPIPDFDKYPWKTLETPNMLKELKLKGAVVAYVADIFSMPPIFVKAVIDMVDREKSTAEDGEFMQNLVAVTKIVDFIYGKCLEIVWTYATEAR